MQVVWIPIYVHNHVNKIYWDLWDKLRIFRVEKEKLGAWRERCGEGGRRQDFLLVIFKYLKD